MSLYMILIWTAFSGIRMKTSRNTGKKLLQQLKKTLKKIARDLRVLLTYSYTTGTGRGSATGTGSGTATGSGSGTATNHGTVCTRNNSFQTQSKKCLKKKEYLARIIRTSSKM